MTIRFLPSLRRRASVTLPSPLSAGLLAILILSAVGWARFEPIRGVVVSGAPVAGARVVGVLSGRSAWTDSVGRFELPPATRSVPSPKRSAKVSGGRTLILDGAGSSFWWVSPSGRQRLLSDVPARILPQALGENSGWVCARPGGGDACWRVLRIGQDLAVAGSGLGRAGWLLPEPMLADTLAVWIPGRGERTVPASVHGFQLVRIPPLVSVAGDFHTHTYLTDGSHTQEDVVAHAFGGKYSIRDANGTPLRDSVAPGNGLDWMANSEHGGSFPLDPYGKPYAESPHIQLKGIPNGGSMWRWQSIRELSWPILDSLRRVYPDKHLFQGLEWNVPGHEHASVGILAASPEPISRFEFFFDGADGDTVGAGWSDVASKDRVVSHAKALAGARWLRDHHRDSSWFVVNHPSRLRITFIQDFRDFQDAAGPVFLGIEAFPGHQKAPNRGHYGYTPPPPDDPWNARTWGGADRMIARVGGVMDALWSEGRRLWIFANSDFHLATGFDHYPGEYNKNVTRVLDKTALGILAGWRSGATVATMGDLVDSFSLELDDGFRAAAMGGELATAVDSVTVVVRYHVPSRSALGDSPVVDHIDLIRGEVGRKILPGDPDYATDSVANVSMIAWARTVDLPTGADGWREARWRVPTGKSSYFRIRGSSLPRGTAGWTDSLGNPLCDELQYPNNEEQAKYNRWFYSNPVFLKVP